MKKKDLTEVATNQYKYVVAELLSVLPNFKTG